MNILLSALGMTPEIIEETIGFFNHAGQDFYADSAFFSQIQAARQQADIAAVDELWLVATDQPAAVPPNGKKAPSVRDKFAEIQRACAPYGTKIRLFILQDVPDIHSAKDANAFHDLTLRLVAAAKKREGGGKLYLSLACGRKTMSAAMQDAAHCFGCEQLVHILGDKKEDALPVLLGAVATNPALSDLQKEVEGFPAGDIVPCPPSVDFLGKIQAQKKRSQHFFTTYYLKEEESRANFPILYTLPPDKIDALKREHIGIDPDPSRQKKELDWLKRLPKTDLHCHLGGVLSPEEMIAVAGCYEPQLTQTARDNPAFAQWRQTLQPPAQTPRDGWKTWRKEKAKQLRVPDHLIAAAVLLAFRGQPEALDACLYGQYRQEAAFCRIGLEAYEALGDLQGSALLRDEAALRKTVQLLLQRCRAENLFYLELRCSPLNYASAAFPAQKVLQAILEELEREADAVQSSVLLIATRHGKKETIAKKTRESLALARKMQSEAVRGFDLAGDEASVLTEDLRPSFLEIMRDCRNITIHAGETAPAKKIWEAVYHLNAERIGHGLTLHKHPELMGKFLERGIGIEMCPSSNFQIVGFRDNYLSKTAKRKIYPLKQYLERELKVSINTDDPGISRTTATNELHRAARLTPGGLSKWEILQLVCNGFRTAFYPYEQKKRLMRRVEKALGKLIEEGKL